MMAHDPAASVSLDLGDAGKVAFYLQGARQRAIWTPTEGGAIGQAIRPCVQNDVTGALMAVPQLTGFPAWLRDALQERILDIVKMWGGEC